ncbi:MAG TPA: hypothetical protein VNO30_05550 [Kofleriaceae bacterium]|nr:hypothetical protein [Kofleriaceae bacterium]
MSRGDRRTIAAAAAAAAAIGLALGGCMRIYPDPELPDIVVEWLPEFTCVEDGERVVVSLVVDDPADAPGPVTAPCADAIVRLDDVARVRHQLAAKLEDAMGQVIGNYEQEIDLRDGLSERIFVFFRDPDVIDDRAEWRRSGSRSSRVASAQR